MGFLRKLFGQEPEHIQISSEEFSLVLARYCSSANKKLFKIIIDGAETNDIHLEPDQKTRAEREVMMIVLWLVGFGLSGYEKAEKAIQVLFRDFARARSTHLDDLNERTELQLFLYDTFEKRYQEYCELWDAESKGMQSILVHRMIQYVVFEGDQNQHIWDAQLTFEVNLYILTGMQTMAEWINSFEFTD